MNSEDREITIEGVPFVPATDLLDEAQSKLSEYELISIAMALYLTCPDTVTGVDEKSKWRVYARARGVDRKITAKRS